MHQVVVIKEYTSMGIALHCMCAAMWIQVMVRKTNIQLLFQAMEIKEHISMGIALHVCSNADSSHGEENKHTTVASGHGDKSKHIDWHCTAFHVCNNVDSNHGDENKHTIDAAGHGDNSKHIDENFEDRSEEALHSIALHMCNNVRSHTSSTSLMVKKLPGGAPTLPTSNPTHLDKPPPPFLIR